ncbi:hypothetical protein SAMN05444003_2442 [Cognatiyoonia sediminum]|uniref:Uncharacterized protein n=1 Tax=Cognatiyoonia sediminum TaxID=1508389 RepID=A0A1M5R0V2_9RHOB|nr:hypothetical protein [Cognatiyoonia sediminum]SHH20005.1 hypothetical protein SAMN05444003_2442 [Cognatiyoonia sediminum]
MLRSISALAAFSILAGCLNGVGSNDAAGPIESNSFLASSSFEGATTMTGELDVAGFGTLGFSVETDSNGNSTFLAAPLTPKSSLPELFHPNAGSAPMSGNWAVAYAANGINFGDEGDVALTLDFEKGTLSGSGDGLVLAGQFVDGVLTGTASFNGASGQLEGVVGSNTSVGFFVGPNFVGAFSVSN